MPSLTQTRDAAVAVLRAGLPEVRRVEAFSGELDLSTASGKNIGYGDRGSLFLAVGEAENAAPPESLDFDMKAAFGAFAVVRMAGKPEIAESVALVLAEQVAMLVHGAVFGLAGLSPARVLAIAPITDEELGKKGLAVWAVTWEQNLVFDVPDTIRGGRP